MRHRHVAPRRLRAGGGRSGRARALGRHPEGRPWRVGIKNPFGDSGVARTVDLIDMTLAVSGGYGTVLEPSGRHHHIFDPVSGLSAATLIDVAVIAPTATAADGLSTAIYVAGEARAANLLAAYPGARAIVTRVDGTSVKISPRHAA